VHYIITCPWRDVTTSLGQVSLLRRKTDNLPLVELDCWITKSDILIITKRFLLETRCCSFDKIGSWPFIDT
jgi:hypothetical protein